MATTYILSTGKDEAYRDTVSAAVEKALGAQVEGRWVYREVGEGSYQWIFGTDMTDEEKAPIEAASGLTIAEFGIPMPTEDGEASADGNGGIPMAAPGGPWIPPSTLPGPAWVGPSGVSAPMHRVQDAVSPAPTPVPAPPPTGALAVFEDDDSDVVLEIPAGIALIGSDLSVEEGAFDAARKVYVELNVRGADETLSQRILAGHRFGRGGHVVLAGAGTYHYSCEPTGYAAVWIPPWANGATPVADHVESSVALRRVLRDHLASIFVPPIELDADPITEETPLLAETIPDDFVAPVTPTDDNPKPPKKGGKKGK